MVFSWFKQRRRKKLLARPLPVMWRGYIRGNVPLFSRLTAQEQSKLCDDARIFIAEKNWEGCGGLEMTEEIQVTVALQACLLVLGLNVDCYDRVQTILVYPAAYLVPLPENLPDGHVVEEGVARLGEAHYRGPVILSWQEVLESSRKSGNGTNLVFHEFAHQIDMLNGSLDGIPPLDERLARRWQKVMTAEYRRLCNDANAGRPSVLDSYGTTSEAEFFAVATECFFDSPRKLRNSTPRLYELLSDFYRQDPAPR
jgi:MtfA peptidase